MMKRFLLAAALLCLLVVGSLTPLVGQDSKKRIQESQPCCGNQQEPNEAIQHRTKIIAFLNSEEGDDDKRKNARPETIGIVCPSYSIGNGLYYCRECTMEGDCPHCVSKSHPYPANTPAGNCQTGDGCDPLGVYGPTKTKAMSALVRKLQANVAQLPELPDSTWEPTWTQGTHVLTRQIIDFKSPDGRKTIRAKLFALFIDPREDGHPLQPIYVFTGGEIKKEPHEQPHYVVAGPATPGGPYMCTVEVGSSSFLIRTRSKLE